MTLKSENKRGKMGLRWSLELALASYVQFGDSVIVDPLSPYRPGLSSKWQSPQRQSLLLHLGLRPTARLNQRAGQMGAKLSSSFAARPSELCLPRSLYGKCSYSGPSYLIPTHVLFQYVRTAHAQRSSGRAL